MASHFTTRAVHCFPARTAWHASGVSSQQY